MGLEGMRAGLYWVNRNDYLLPFLGISCFLSGDG